MITTIPKWHTAREHVVACDFDQHFVERFRILFTVGNVDREISVDIAVDIAVDTRSIVGRHSVDTWSTLGR